MLSETFKEHRRTVIITSIVILLPMIAGIIMWDKLPDMIATHFSTDNEPNGWSSKAFTVFGIPAILLALQIFMFIISSADPKRKNISGKALDIVLWIIPCCSLFVGVVSYSYALGMPIKLGIIVSAFIGLLFIIIGSVLPRSETNHTIGVRTAWALNDPENWSKTNRLAGYCYVIGGIIILLTCWMNLVLITIGVMAVACILPLLYSYRLYKNKLKTKQD